MLNRLPRPTLRNKRLTSKKSSSEYSSPLDGVIVPTVGCISICGRKHLVNEDRVFYSTLAAALGSEESEMLSFSDMLSLSRDDINPEDVLIAGVFDGHGGVGCVDYVSKNLPKMIAKAVCAENRSFSQVESAVLDGFKACEDGFMGLAAKTGDFSGCCALMTLVNHNQVFVSWTGDCRAVFYDGKRCEQLSADHRPSDHLEYRRIVENGGTVSNNRLQGVLAPSRSFGDYDVRAASPEGVLISEPSVTTKLSISDLAIRKQNAFLILASDGIWDVFTNEGACDIVAKTLKSSGNNVDLAAAKLVEEAYKTSADDLSCVVISWSIIPWDRFSGITQDSGAFSDEGEKF